MEIHILNTRSNSKLKRNTISFTIPYPGKQGGSLGKPLIYALLLYDLNMIAPTTTLFTDRLLTEPTAPRTPLHLQRALDIRPVWPSDITRKNPPPSPSPPKYIPILINNPLLHGRNRIPDHIKLNNAYSIFRLFFDNEILIQICQNTNDYAKFYPSKTDKP